MKTRTALLTLIVSTAVSATTLQAMPPPEAWEIGPLVRGVNYSKGLPAHPKAGPRGSIVMDFPVGGLGEVDALTTAVGPLSGAKQIKLKFRVDAPRGARFVAIDTPNEPATISIYFQRANDNWTGKGRYESYRWYSPARAVVPLAQGEHIVTVQLDEAWTNVKGRTNREDPEGFAGALQNTARMGLAFGSPSRRSHGVFATQPSRFTLLGLEPR